MAALPAGVVDITVVIVSWNTRELLAACLASLAREAVDAGLSIETLVVDNASSDGTPAMLRERYPWVETIALDENRGFAAGNNLAIRQARGDAVLLLNPDAELLPGSLAALWRGLHAAPHVGLVGPLLLNPDGSVQSAGYRFPGLAQALLDLFPLHPRLMASAVNGRVHPGDGRSPIAIDHPLGACMLVRREAIDAVGPLDQRYFMYSEEIDWCRRLRAAGWTILTVPPARVIHHGGQSTGQVAPEMRRHLHRSRARDLRRARGRWLPRVVAGAAGIAAAWAAVRSQHERASNLRDLARLYREVAGKDDA